MGRMKVADWISIVLLEIGGLNWGLVGLFNFNLVTKIFGFGFWTNAVYTVVGVGALYSIYSLFKLTKRK